MNCIWIVIIYILVVILFLVFNHGAHMNNKDLE